MLNLLRNSGNFILSHYFQRRIKCTIRRASTTALLCTSRRCSSTVSTHQSVHISNTNSLSKGVYLIWAFSPADWLHACGIYYYPSRYWAVAVPVAIMCTPPLVFAAFAAHNMMRVPDFTETCAMGNAADELTPAEVDEQEAMARALPGRIPDIKDLPLHIVNARLYGVK
jgi:hypothetical protein